MLDETIYESTKIKEIDWSQREIDNIERLKEAFAELDPKYNI